MYRNFLVIREAVEKLVFEEGNFPHLCVSLAASLSRSGISPEVLVTFLLQKVLKGSFEGRREESVQYWVDTGISIC